jgi:hypothetical protein
LVGVVDLVLTRKAKAPKEAPMTMRNRKGFGGLLTFLGEGVWLTVVRRRDGSLVKEWERGGVDGL